MIFPKNWEGIELMQILFMSPVPTKENNESIQVKGLNVLPKQTEQT